MTSIEWLKEKLFNDFGLAFSDNIFEQANEMHKQEIMNTYIIADSESTQEDSEHYALKFYERTYVSKGSDEAEVPQQEISDNSPKEENKTSYGEISDEEIEEEISKRYMHPTQDYAFRDACKWYTEQLKQGASQEK